MALIVDQGRSGLHGDAEIEVVLPHEQAFAFLGVDAAKEQAKRTGDDDRRKAAVPKDASVLEAIVARRAGCSRDRSFIADRETERSGRAADTQVLRPDIAMDLERTGSGAPIDRAVLEFGEFSND